MPKRRSPDNDRPSDRPRPERGDAPKADGGGATPAGMVRLQKVLADAGVASRRACEVMIQEGRVEVNGTTVTALPAFVNPLKDQISIDGDLLSRNEIASERVYVMLNKPDNTLGTTRDELEYKKGGRRTVSDLVDHPSKARLFPVGRLDYHSVGLVLMTNDGELAERLTHAKYGMTKTYRVWISNAITEETLEMLRRRVGKREAMDAAGRETGGVRIVMDENPRRARRSLDDGRGDRDGDDRGEGGGGGAGGGMKVLEIVVREGASQPLDEMLSEVGCRVKRIARTAIGPLRLIGIAPGEWRDLTWDELIQVREAAGLDASEARKRSGSRSRGGRSGVGGGSGGGGRGGAGGTKGRQKRPARGAGPGFGGPKPSSSRGPRKGGGGRGGRR